MGSEMCIRDSSLDRLRELVQVPLVTQRSMAGTHLYESLGTLFRLVDRGNLEDVATRRPA